MKRILIIDDEVDLEFIFNTMLEDFIADKKLHIDFFNNPKECLAYFNQNPEIKYDVIFSDINMPQINGIEFVSELRDMGYQGQISFISAYMQEDYKEEMHRLNIATFYSKPLDFENIIEVLGL